MENSKLPSEEWKVHEMKDYIRKHRLNKTKIVLLGMCRNDMIKGLKKLKHFQLPVGQIVSSLGCDVSLLHNLIWDIEEMIMTYVNYYRHIYSLSWGQLSKIYREQYKLKCPGYGATVSRGMKRIKLAKCIVKDFPHLTIKDFPTKAIKPKLLEIHCEIKFHINPDEKENHYFKSMMYYFGDWNYRHTLGCGDEKIMYFIGDYTEENSLKVNYHTKKIWIKNKNNPKLKSMIMYRQKGMNRLIYFYRNETEVDY